MPQPAEVEQLTAQLLRMYRHAWDKITAQEQALINSWSSWRRVERLARLQELRATVEQLMGNADEQALRFVSDQLPQAYLLGAAASGIGAAAWTQPDLDAVGVLARDTYTGLLEATSFVRDSTKTLIRTLAREHVADKLIVGQTAEQSARELAKALEGRRIGAVVYKDGSVHGLSEYATVVARTKSAEAYNTGNLNRFVAGGITYVECFDSPDCGLDGHDDEEKPNGQVYPIATMEEFEISHPNCTRSWGARPDVTTDQEAADAVGSATDAQNADQAQVAVTRQEEAISRAFSRRSGALSDSASRVSGASHAAVIARRAAKLSARGARVNARA